MNRNKSTVDEIRARFDADVERFSDLETGQKAAVDSPQCGALIASAAVVCSPQAKTILDIGCGAGNGTLRLLDAFRRRRRDPKASIREQSTRGRPGNNADQSPPPDGNDSGDLDSDPLECILVDLSQPMLDRARQRVDHSGLARSIRTVQSDVRLLLLPPDSVDIILASAVLHHLRSEQEWANVFASMHRWLRPGGSVWIYDMVESEIPQWSAVEKQNYGEYLVQVGGESYRDKVFAYIDQEDSPRSIGFQLQWLQRAGFDQIDVLHKRHCFAAFGATKK